MVSLDDTQLPKDHDRWRVSHQLFVLSAAIILVGYILVQVVIGAMAQPEDRKKHLMAEIRAELVDEPLTETQLQWPLMIDGEFLTLADLPRDRLILLNFWATWCPPCQEELPSLFELREKMADRNFLMVAVSYDESWDDLVDFFDGWLGKMPPPGQMLVVKDPHLDEGESLRETFGTIELPDTYVVYNGRVLSRFVNARDWVSDPMVDYFKLLAPELAPEPAPAP